MPPNYVMLGARIKQLRNRRGMTQISLAERVGRSSTYLSYLENGLKCMSLETFIMIANALNASADDLLRDSLANTIKAVNHDFSELISDCSEYESRVLYEVLVSTKTALRNNKRYLLHRRL